MSAILGSFLRFGTIALAEAVLVQQELLLRNAKEYYRLFRLVVLRASPGRVISQSLERLFHEPGDRLLRLLEELLGLSRQFQIVKEQFNLPVATEGFQHRAPQLHVIFR